MRVVWEEGRGEKGEEEKGHIGGRDRRRDRIDSQVVIQHKKVLAGILHDVVTEVLDEKGYSGRAAILVGGGDGQR